MQMSVVISQLPIPWPAQGLPTLDVGLLLFLLLLVVVIYVFTRNFVRVRAERFEPDTQPEEVVRDRIKTNGLLFQTESVLTTHRIFQFRKFWLLSWRWIDSLALQDATRVSFVRRINFWLLVLVILISLVGIRPLLLVAFLLLMERRRYAVRFAVEGFFPPRLPPSVDTSFPSELGSLERFYRNAQTAWAARRVEKGQPVTFKEQVIRDTDLRWGRPVWLAVGAYALAAILQRALEPHISLNDYFFAPLYLGIPAGLARRGLHDAVWSALFGMAMVIAIAFPGPLSSDLPQADVPQYIFLLVAVTSIALAAHAAARWVHPAIAFAALLLWPILVALYDSPLFFEYALYARTALAMAAAVLVAAISHAEDDNV